MYEIIERQEIILGESPQPDGSVIQRVFVPAQIVEHDDGAIEFVPSRVDVRHVYPNVDEF